MTSQILLFKFLPLFSQKYFIFSYQEPQQGESPVVQTESKPGRARTSTQKIMDHEAEMNKYLDEEHVVEEEQEIRKNIFKLN